MQTVIRRSDLTQETPTVAAIYDDDVVVDVAAHGEGMVVISVAPSAIEFKREIGRPRLVGDWRHTNKQKLVATEAARRIDAVFPDYSQRNSMNEMNGYVLQYGADATRWPAAARDRKSEIDRCWNYVSAIRAKNAAMLAGALPPDPTSNAYWPTSIAPYQPNPHIGYIASDG